MEVMVVVQVREAEVEEADTEKAKMGVQLVSVQHTATHCNTIQQR